MRRMVGVSHTFPSRGGTVADTANHLRVLRTRTRNRSGHRARRAVRVVRALRTAPAAGWCRVMTPCTRVDPTYFDPPEESAGKLPVVYDKRHGAAVCGPCPIRAQCLADGMRNRE